MFLIIRAVRTLVKVPEWKSSEGLKRLRPPVPLQGPQIQSSEGKGVAFWFLYQQYAFSAHLCRFYGPLKVGNIGPFAPGHPDYRYGPLRARYLLRANG